MIYQTLSTLEHCLPLSNYFESQIMHSRIKKSYHRAINQTVDNYVQIKLERKSQGLNFAHLTTLSVFKVHFIHSPQPYRKHVTKI